MSFVVFSGGTACNHILEAFHTISQDNQVNYILGISDNGGSTSELLRVLGGPSVGDLRSRLLKLMDLFPGNGEAKAIKRLLCYRLPVNPHVNEEWLLVVNGKHKLWQGISIEKKETICRLLAVFDKEIKNKAFNFCHGSIGNFLLTGARLYTGSLESALFTFASIIGVPGLVTPVIHSDQTATIAATLISGATLMGQCEISHPTTTPKEECNNIFFSKDSNQQLASPIKRIFYSNKFGHEVYPIPNPKVISHISSRRSLVYSIGSLYTSLVPCLILKSIGNAIAQSESLRHKILLLNGSTDRETHGYSALDFIHAITNALHQSQLLDAHPHSYLPSDLHTPPQSPYDQSAYLSPTNAFITHLVYLDNTPIPIDFHAIKNLGIECIPVKGSLSPEGEPIYHDHVLTHVFQNLV